MSVRTRTPGVPLVVAPCRGSPSNRWDRDEHAGDTGLHLGYRCGRSGRPGSGSPTDTPGASRSKSSSLVWPVALLLLARAGRVRWSFAIIAMIISVAAFVASWIRLGEGATYFLPTGHLTCSTAVLIAVIGRNQPPPQTNWARSSLAAAIAVVLIIAWFTVPQAPLLPRAVRVAIATLLSLGMCSLLGHVVSSCTSRLARLLTTRPIGWLGGRSYGIYLYRTATIWPLRRYQSVVDRHRHLAAARSCVLRDFHPVGRTTPAVPRSRLDQPS